MSSLTKEQLRERARDKVKSLELAVTQTAFADSRAELEEELKLARIALASLEAEPIYQLWDEGYYDTQKETYDAVLNAVGTGVRGRIVYTAPPAPVSVPDEITFEKIAEITASQGYEYSINECICAASWWNACRAAMLQGADGNSPVIPDGWVLVPVEPTYQMCEAMGMPWERPRFPDRYKAMLAAAPVQEVK
ncbi:hypothetical protein OWK27_03455 [Enterobacter cloacae complex sp. 2022EL-00788]|uniref:hypothetical protein n=1 Tax=Enterobacter cloacae complex sp. 2022EL-00788 TaxID=2996512 RepID=UPI00226D425B|nr:hypothetical protein [Enterobacter cloacae complex sp. 2022EL-00788]MCY0771775.1 hypothetical protein [Enterobacter cloacae complex sp. 2022EL-00788]